MGVLSGIKKVYVSMLKVFVIFVPIGFIFFGNQSNYCNDYELICHAFESFDSKTFMSNILALTVSYNREWWFIISYIVALLCFPIVCKIIVNNNDFWKSFWILSVLGIMVGCVFPLAGNSEIPMFYKIGENAFFQEFFCQRFPHSISFYFGILWGYNNNLEKLQVELKRSNILNIGLSFGIIATIVVLRTTFLGRSMDPYYVPVFIIAFKCIVEEIPILKEPFKKIGGHSTTIWLTHSFFLYYFEPIQRIILFPRYAILIVVWLLIISYGISWVIDNFYEFIERKIKHITCARH